MPDTARPSPITRGERLNKLRTAIGNIKEKNPKLTLEDIGVQAGHMGRKTVSKALATTTDVDSISDSTITSLETFVRQNGEPRGFVSSDVYLTIADGMGASIDNEWFAQQYRGSYCVLRAHVPSMRPLMSKLVIRPDDDQRVIRYDHYHKVSDALSLLRDDELFKTPNQVTGRGLAKTTQDDDQFKYEGFVFNCGNRAFLLATAPDTGHAKEMILNLRTTGRNPGQATIRGLLLTLSADEREPFAARVLVQKMQDDQLEQEKWKPGLKKWNWDDEDGFADRPEILREFSPSQNYGILRLHAEGVRF
jgi:hypothetical protein